LFFCIGISGGHKTRAVIGIWQQGALCSVGRGQSAAASSPLAAIPLPRVIPHRRRLCSKTGPPEDCSATGAARLPSYYLLYSYSHSLPDHQTLLSPSPLPHAFHITLTLSPPIFPSPLPNRSHDGFFEFRGQWWQTTTRGVRWRGDTGRYRAR
jgi:hypothetical protein